MISLQEKGEAITGVAIAKAQSELSISKAIKAENILSLIKQHDKQSVTKLIATIVIESLTYFNVKQTMTEDQIMVFAMDFTEKYYTDSTDDLLMMFKLARQNALSPHYNVIDSTKLFEWYTEYLEKRSHVREAEMKREASVTVVDTLIETSEKGWETLKQIQEMLNKKRVEEINKSYSKTESDLELRRSLELCMPYMRSKELKEKIEELRRGSPYSNGFDDIINMLEEELNSRNPVEKGE